MKKAMLDRSPIVAAILLVVLIVAACTIPLREDASETTSAMPADEAPDPLASKLAECRSVTYEQKDALTECRKAWSEKRRQFLGKPPSASHDNGPARGGSSLFVPPKDESRRPSGYPSIQQSGKE
jgi:conjugative transfer region protein TrbK